MRAGEVVIIPVHGAACADQRALLEACFEHGFSESSLRGPSQGQMAPSLIMSENTTVRGL